MTATVTCTCPDGHDRIGAGLVNRDRSSVVRVKEAGEVRYCCLRCWRWCEMAGHDWCAESDGEPVCDVVRRAVNAALWR